MAKVTSKLQVTIPKTVADQYGIRPGNEIEFVPAGDVIRVVMSVGRPAADVEARLRLFDQATERQRRRETAVGRSARRRKAGTRGWTREDLYRRGVPR